MHRENLLQYRIYFPSLIPRETLVCVFMDTQCMFVGVNVPTWCMLVGVSVHITLCAEHTKLSGNKIRNLVTLYNISVGTYLARINQLLNEEVKIFDIKDSGGSFLILFLNQIRI